MEGGEGREEGERRKGRRGGESRREGRLGEEFKFYFENHFGEKDSEKRVMKPSILHMLKSEAKRS